MSLLQEGEVTGTPPIECSRTIILEAPPTAPPQVPPAVEKFLVVVHVRDEEGNPLEGASVTLDAFSATTDVNGGVIFEDVPKGDYTLKVELEGYEAYEGRHSITEDTSIDVTLKKIVKPPVELTPLLIAGGLVAGGLSLIAVLRRRRVRK